MNLSKNFFNVFLLAGMAFLGSHATLENPIPSLSLPVARGQTVEQQRKESLRLYGIGSQQYQQGQFREALKTFEQVLIIVRAIDDKWGEGRTLNYMGLVYSNLGQYAEALRYYQPALEIVKQIGDKDGEGATLSNIGLVYDSLGQYAEALRYHQQSLEIARQIGDKDGKGTTLGNIGLVYHNLGQYAEALRYYRQALEIARQIGNKKGEGTTLSNIGLVYGSLGQYAEALRYYQSALEIVRQIGDKRMEGATLNNIGSVYDSLGQYAEALRYYQPALEIVKQMGDKQAEGTTLNNIWAVYGYLGQYAEALRYHQSALEIARQIDDKRGEGTTLSKIGSVYDSLGQYAEALRYHQSALEIVRQIGDKRMEGATLNNIGSVYDSLGQYAEALRYYQPALEIVKQMGDKQGEGRMLNNIGGVYRNLGQYGEAEKHLVTALEVAESLRVGLTDEQKISIFETQAGSYPLLQQVLVAQNKNNSALEIAQRGRARAFAELLAQKLSAAPDAPASIKPPNLQQIQQIAAAQNATIVEYSLVYDEFPVGDISISDREFPAEENREWFDSELYIWVVKPSGEITFRKSDIKPLWQQQNTSFDRLVADARCFANDTCHSKITVTQRSGFPLEVRSGNNSPFDPEAARQKTTPFTPNSKNSYLQQLHQLLIEPIADLLPANPSDKIIFIPQGSLFLAPFAALQDEAGKYLIEKHTILTAPSIQVLDFTRQHKISRGGDGVPAPQEVLIVGNPTMPSVALKIGETPQPLLALPGAEKEAGEIAQLFKTTALIGSQATEMIVVQKMERSRIIHLATHGSFDSSSGINSWIALAPGGNDDGLLTAAEIFDLKLNADLVVLSACDTGRGKISGDGVVGLSRSLIYSGVSSVLVSLKKVPDYATALLMREFYQNWQSSGNKAQALRSAMLTTMKSYPDPENWAAFTLIGEAD